MGLDLVEFVMAVEESFQTRLLDQDFAALTTPRKLINYLATHLPVAKTDFCLTQRAFYRLRSSLVARTGCLPSTPRPSTPLLGLIAIADRNGVWEGVRHDLGITTTIKWPRLASGGWFDLCDGRLVTLRDAVAFIVAFFPYVLNGHANGWTRSQISTVVHGLIEKDLGVCCDGPDYTDDLRWSDDMGID